VFSLLQVTIYTLTCIKLVRSSGIFQVTYYFVIFVVLYHCFPVSSFELSTFDTATAVLERLIEVDNLSGQVIDLDNYSVIHRAGKT